RFLVLSFRGIPQRSQNAHTASGIRLTRKRTARRGQWYRETLVGRLGRGAKRVALKGNMLFDAMRPEELDEILKFASERRVRRGQTIFQRGDDGSSLIAVF